MRSVAQSPARNANVSPSRPPARQNGLDVANASAAAATGDWDGGRTILVMREIVDRAQVYHYLGRLSYAAKAEGFVPTAARFFPSLIELAERHHIVGMTLNSPFQSTITNQLPPTRRAHGLHLRLAEPENDAEYVVETPYGTDYREDLALPAMRVTNPLEFMRQINPLCGLIGLDAGHTPNPRRELWPYVSHPDVRATWAFYGASVTDFANPSSFVEKITYSLTHPTFEGLGNWTPIGRFDDAKLGERRVFARHEVQVLRLRST